MSLLQADALYPLITEELAAQSPKKYNSDEWSLLDLDKWRQSTLPGLLAEREDFHLSKDELVLLMDWKLAKGKFRPTLPKLIKSNDEDTVRSTTSAGLSMFMDFAVNKSWADVTLDEYQAATKAALKKLCELKGVGPATGSLILSLLAQRTQLAPPFFSDEAFMYVVRDSLRPGQPIKYNVKEYVEEFIPILFNYIAANGSSMVALEKCAWSLKMYHIYRIDKLADIKLPFEIEEDELAHLSEAAKFLPPKIEKKPKVEKKPKIEKKTGKGTETDETKKTSRRTSESGAATKRRKVKSE